VEIKEIKLSKI